jgi:hypothetical protein
MSGAADNLVFGSGPRLNGYLPVSCALGAVSEGIWRHPAGHGVEKHSLNAGILSPIKHEGM